MRGFSRHCTSTPLIVVSASGEDVILESFACNYEGHLVTRRDKGDITAAALHFELAVDFLRWVFGLRGREALALLGRCLTAAAGLMQIWYTAGTYDHVNF